MPSAGWGGRECEVALGGALGPGLCVEVRGDVQSEFPHLRARGSPCVACGVKCFHALFPVPGGWGRVRHGVNWDLVPLRPAGAVDCVCSQVSLRGGDGPFVNAGVSGAAVPLPVVGLV